MPWGNKSVCEIYGSLCSGQAQGQNLDEFYPKIYNSLGYQRDFFFLQKLEQAQKHSIIIS